MLRKTLDYQEDKIENCKYEGFQIINDYYISVCAYAYTYIFVYTHTHYWERVCSCSETGYLTHAPFRCRLVEQLCIIFMNLCF